MPTIYFWMIERSGAGLRIQGEMHHASGVKEPHHKLTGITSVHWVQGQQIAFRGTTRVCILGKDRPE